MAPGRLAVVPVGVAADAMSGPAFVDPLVIDPLVIDPLGGFDHHLAKPLRIEPGTPQYRCHHLVVEQIFEARLIAAAFGASSHGPLLTCEILCSIGGKHVRIVTGVRKFRGNWSKDATQFAFKWSRHPTLDRRDAA